MIKERIASNLQSYMSFAGVKQTQLAEHLNVSRAAVSNWVTGRNSLDIEYIPEICRFLGITIPALFGEEIDSEEHLLISVYRGLNDSEKQMLMEFATFLRWRR